MAAETVTYRGATDPGDPSNVFRVPGDPEDHVFPKDVAVSGVPADVVKVLRDQEGHDFDFGSAAKKSATPAEELKGEES